MILQRLQRHSRSFQRKPLQQQAEEDQQLSIQEMNLQGLVLHQCSHHHLQSRRLCGNVQPQGMFHPPTATPMTPGYPPRPPVEALPKPVQEVASQPTLKHPLPEPAQQGPPNKQVRHKAFPKE